MYLIFHKTRFTFESSFESNINQMVEPTIVKTMPTTAIQVKSIIKQELIGQQMIQLAEMPNGQFQVTSWGQLGFKRYIKNTVEKAHREFSFLWGNVCDYYLGRDAHDE